MRKLIILLYLVAVTSMGITLPAYADDGNNLLANCKTLIRAYDQDPDFIHGDVGVGMGAGNCAGLLKGVWDTMVLYRQLNLRTNAQLDKTFLVCYPEGTIIDIKQAVQMTINYLEEHPEKLPERDTALALLAFRNAFPCT